VELVRSVSSLGAGLRGVLGPMRDGSRWTTCLRIGSAFGDIVVVTAGARAVAYFHVEGIDAVV
jgi:hypothetical protein